MDLDIYNRKHEFKYIIENYILLLLGLKDNNLIECKKRDEEPENLIFYNDSNIYFFPYKNCEFGYYLQVSSRYCNFDLTLVNKVLKKLINVSYNNYMSNTRKKFTYINFQHCVSSYEIAVQDAIVAHLTGLESNEENGYCNKTILMLLRSLEEWSTKTYEGKKMPFGFIIDLNLKSKSKINYIDFLSEEYSATLTDGITSIIMLDSEGNLIGYGSIIKNESIISCELDNCLPIRFAQIIKEYIPNGSKRIGIFLLTCGDIMVVKDSKVELIKRNGRWANFSYTSFLDAMSRYNNTKDIDKTLLESIFATAIDVSLSHSGGIIAIVNDGNKLYDSKYNDKEYNDKRTILSECDNLLMDYEEKNIISILKDSGEKDYSIKKRIYKRNIIKSLLNNMYYVNINRKLRCELTGLDGASIIQKDGKIVSFGAIIQNEKGSSGGGRGSAAKRLSDYGGLAIKISTDGYIEVYIDKEIKYYIK